MSGGTTTLQIKLTTDGQGNVTATLDQVKDKLAQIKPAAQEGASGIDKMLGSLNSIKGMMQAWGVYEVVKEAIGAFIEANVEAQKLQAALVGVTGSAQAAAQAYATIQSVAASSVSNSQQLTDAWVRLANVGITPTQESMQGLANLAAQTGQSVDTVANAVAMAMAGHYRGLQQMGIQAEAVGDKLVVSFQGQTQIIDKTSQAIAAYVDALGKAPAAIAAQEAQVSALGGQWDQLKKRVGDFFESFTTGTSAVTAFVGKAAHVIDELNQINQSGGRLAQLVALMRFRLVGMGGFEAMAQAAKMANEQAAKATPTLQSLAEKYEATAAAALGLSGGQQQLAGSLSSVLGFMRQLPEQAAQAAAAQLKLDDSGKTLAASLEQQANTMGQTAVEAAIYELTLGKLKGASIDVAAAVLAAAGDLDDAREKMKASAQFDAAVKSAQQYIETLTNEAATVGMTAEQQKLYNASVQAAKAPTDALRQAILQKAQADVTAMEAQKRIQDQIKQDDALQQLLYQVDPLQAAFDQTLAKFTLLNDALQRGKISPQQYADAAAFLGQKLGEAAENADTMGKALEQLRAELDPQEAALQKLKSTLAELEKLYVAGAVGPEEYFKRSQQAYAKFGQDLGDDKYVKAFEQIWQGAAGDIFDLFTSGFHNAGQVMLKDMQNIAKQLIEQWAKQKITAYIQQKVVGGGGAGGGGADAVAPYAMGAMAVGGAVGGRGGAVLSGAASGAMVGAQFGSWVGAAIGAVVGAIAGWLGSQPKNPSYSIYGSGTHSGSFTDAFGTFGDDTKNIPNGQIYQIRQQIEAFDNAIAAFLPADQVDRVTAAIHQINKTYTGGDVDSLMRDRMDAMIGVVSPQWKAFLDKLTGVQQMSDAFQGLLGIQKEIKDFASVIVQLNGSPIDLITDKLKNLDQGVSAAKDKLETAIKIQDPKAILDAESNLKQAIQDRYNTEMQMVQNLQQALQSLEQQSLSLNMTIAQRIADLGGANTVGDVAFAGLSNTQAQINASTDAQTTLNLLQQFTSQVDQWLNAAIAQIDAPIQAQIDALEQQRAALEAQAQAAQQAAQARAQFENELRQREIASLQKQLALAQQWAGVLDHADQAIRALMTNNTNPLGGFSQADNLEAMIRDLQTKIAGEKGPQQAKDADQLIQELQQRLQLIQSGNLYDRSSPEYMAAYNQTLSQLHAVEALAGPQASQVDLLQAQIDQLQKLNSTAVWAGNQNVDALNKIAEQEAELKKQEQDNIDKLNAQALEYYTWAQGEAQTAEQKRHDELMDQLKAITGGMDVNAWIAQETSREVDLLNSIDQQLKDFLAAISSGGTNIGGSNGGTGPGNGNHGGGPSPIVPGIPGASAPGITVNVNTTVNGTGMGSQDIAAAVNAGLNDALPSAVPALKRMLKVA